MASDKNNVHFHLNILEISGKNIVNTYINDIRHHLDDRGLKYNFDIVTNEDFYDVNKHTMYGGKTTFPYIHFEKTFDNIRNTLQFNGKSSIETTTPTPIKINTYTPETVDNSDEVIDKPNKYIEEKDTRTNAIIDRFVSYKPLELDGTKTKNSVEIVKPEPIVLDVPSEYSGVIHILLTIDVKKKEHVIEGGITQLNTFLESYSVNKKEV